MEVYNLKKSDEKEWDDYVMRHPESTFYHQIGWKHIVEGSYGHKPYYIFAKEHDEIKGILPLFSVKNVFFGNKLISVPFAPYGGVCANDDMTKNMLLNAAKVFVTESNLDYLEYRNMKEDDLELISNNEYFTLILKLNSDPMLIWNDFRKSMRRYIKHSIENNLVVSSSSNYLDDFYKIYSHNMRDLGTPVHSFAFFKNLLKEFPENTNIAIVRYNDIPIAAVLLLYFKDTVIYGWGSSDRKYSKYSPNYILFWELIKQSCKGKFNYFDFGRSQKEDGTYLFKTGWGAQPKQLYYQYHLYKSRNIPDLSKSNTKRQKFANLWKNLPVYLTNIIGPKIRCNIP